MDILPFTEPTAARSVQKEVRTGAGMVGRRIMYKDLVSGEDGRMKFIESN